ncbi:MAG: hypothetical protein LLG40_06775 [Deltaproteobacteria bacterium]|nr:hypothetical protein [Deltaproteobacteria bacterium]
MNPDLANEAGGIELISDIYSKCETSGSFEYFLGKFIFMLNSDRSNELAEKIRLFASAGEFDKAKSICSEMASDKYSLKCENEQFSKIAERVFPWLLAKGSIRTGFSVMDSTCGLIRDEEVVVIAGRPGDGKTSMGCQIAMTNAMDGKRVQFFSLEMSKELIVEKLEKQLIKDQVFERDHKAIIEKASLQDFKISDESNFTKIASICRSECRARKIDLVVIDYVQIIRDNDLLVTTPDLDKIPIVMERINSLAKELHCPIITMAQLNRAGEKEFRAPILADLAGSSAIEKWAHRVIMLYRPVKDENGNEIDPSKSPNLTIVQLPKNRNSSKIKQYMLYYGEVGIFKEKPCNYKSV